MPAKNRATALAQGDTTAVQQQALEVKRAEDAAKAKAEAQPPKPAKTEPVDIEVHLNVKRWRGRSLVLSIAPEQD